MQSCDCAVNTIGYSVAFHPRAGPPAVPFLSSTCHRPCRIHGWKGLFEEDTDVSSAVVELRVGTAYLDPF